MSRTLKPKASGGSLPLHRQLSERLVRDIRAGLLPDGMRLLPERKMAEEWGVAVGTLRQALQHVEDLGLLNRVHGSGNYIAYAGDKQPVGHIYNLFRLELIGGGGLPTAELLDVARVDKPPHLTRLGSSAKAYRIRRVRRLNDLPATVEEIWLDGERAKGLRADQLSEALYQFYEQRLNITITHVEDQITSAPPPDWRPDGFGPDLPAWGLVERWSFDQDNQAAEFSQNWFNPKTTRYRVRLSQES